MSSESRPETGGDATRAKRKSRGSADAAGRGNLIVVSAPSGAGKSSLVERALKRVSRLRYSISYTTREARGAERDGVDYFFVSNESFRDMQGRGEVLESAEVHGPLYGTHRATVEAMAEKGVE